MEPLQFCREQQPFSMPCWCSKVNLSRDGLLSIRSLWHFWRNPLKGSKVEQNETRRFSLRSPSFRQIACVSATCTTFILRRERTVSAQNRGRLDEYLRRHARFHRPRKRTGIQLCDGVAQLPL